MRTVVALGGNAIASGRSSIAEQRERVRETADPLSRLTDRGHEVVLTHGNGPQVGTLLDEQERTATPDRPLDTLVAETQAQIGYLLADALDEAVSGRVTTVLTRVEVDPEDPAFSAPQKPVGLYLDSETAAARDFETAAVQTPEDEQAHRRVVPSPDPVAVLKREQIARLVADGATVVCGGGGGVPVVVDDGIEGVPAVVDKDHTSALLADTLDADCLVMATDVPFAYRDFGTDERTPIREADAATLRAALSSGTFGEGSMRPKIEACLDFLDAGGDRAVVTTPGDIAAAVDGETGTQIIGPSSSTGDT